MGEADHPAEVGGHPVEVVGHPVEVGDHLVEAGIVITQEVRIAVVREGGTRMMIEVTHQVEDMCINVTETQHMIMIVIDMFIEVMAISEIGLVKGMEIMCIEAKITETGLIIEIGLMTKTGPESGIMVMTETEMYIGVEIMKETGIVIVTETDMMTEIGDVEDIIKEIEIADDTQNQKKNQKKRRSRMKKNREQLQISVLVFVCVETMQTMMMMTMIAKKTSLPGGDILTETKEIHLMTSGDIDGVIREKVSYSI